MTAERVLELPFTPAADPHHQQGHGDEHLILTRPVGEEQALPRPLAARLLAFLAAGLRAGRGPELAEAARRHLLGEHTSGVVCR